MKTYFSLQRAPGGVRLIVTGAPDGMYDLLSGLGMRSPMDISANVLEAVCTTAEQVDAIREPIKKMVVGATENGKAELAWEGAK